MDNIIKEIEADVEYFNKLGFEHLVEKFTRDLNAVNH